VAAASLVLTCLALGADAVRGRLVGLALRVDRLDLLAVSHGAVVLADAVPLAQTLHGAMCGVGTPVSRRGVGAEEDDQLQLQRDPAGVLVVASAPLRQQGGECSIVEVSLGLLGGTGVDSSVQRQDVLHLSCRHPLWVTN
jgi:hypothetical protein